MRTTEFDYVLPRELIAQTPPPRREDARLLVVDRRTGRIQHAVFRELGRYLHAGDVLVLNESRVVPAKVRLRKQVTGGAVQALLVCPAGRGAWEALLKPSSRIVPGSVLVHADAPARPVLTVVRRVTGSRWVVRPADGFGNGRGLAQLGEMPLPPYIRRSGSDLDNGRLRRRRALRRQDRRRYQTVYARLPGSIAAPTAGLHFSRRLLRSLAVRGLEMVKVVLHIGTGTFMPVMGEQVEHHVMAPEQYEVPFGAWRRLRDACREGRRVVAVGTSSVRVLETVGRFHAGGMGATRGVRGASGLFITPGFRFAVTGAMITNFHQPRSTPYVLVCALAGLDLIRRAYAEAIRRRYRLLSYGDAMLIL